MELVMYPLVMAASIGHAVFWAGTFLSFALPTVGAVLAVVALSESGNRQGKLGGKSLAVLTFYMAAAVGVGGAVSGRPVVMLSSFIAGASAVIAYVWIALTRAARSHSRRNPCR